MIDHDSQDAWDAREPHDEQAESLDRFDAKLAAAVASLPAARQPGALLEERTVRRLRAAGILGGRRRSWLPREWLVAGVAASLALFAGGVATGQWIAARQTADMFAAHQQATLGEMSALVQQTGTAYVSALSRLAEAGAPDADTAGREQVRDAAVQFLHQAANEVARLAPNDPVTAKILQGFDHAALQHASGNGGERRRQIVWF